MQRKYYNIIYAAALVIILTLLIAIPNLNDFWQMLLGGIAIILTSIFTYSKRHDIFRKRRQKDDQQ